MSNLKRKKLSFAILDILRQYTDENHRLSQNDIVELLEKDYDIKADRKSVKRNITSLLDMGYPIEFTETLRMYPNKDGVMEESYILSDFYLEREFTDAELRLLIDMLPFCRQKDVQVIIKHFIEVIDKMATSSEQLHMLRNALNVTDSQEMDMESINAALLLLSHKDEIQRDIWKKFIRVNVKCGEGIELADCEDSDLEVDKYTLLRVNRAGHTIAWICVQKNLYLYCKKTRKDANNSWHGAADSGYQWIHLSPSGHGTYQMRDNFNLKKSDIIDITYILRDIDAK